MQIIYLYMCMAFITTLSGIQVNATQPEILAGVGLLALLLLVLLGIIKPQWLANLLSHIQFGLAQAAEWCGRTIEATLSWGSDWGRKNRHGEDESLYADSQSLEAANGEDRRTVWTGFIVIARCVYFVTAAYLLMAAFSLDTGRSCAVQFGEDCAVHLPIDASTANGALWFLGIGFFGAMLAEAIGWLAPQLHLVPSPNRVARWALAIYATLGTLVGLGGATLLAVLAQMALQHKHWTDGVDLVTTLQAAMVNWAVIGASIALIFGLGGAIALALLVVQMVCEILHFLVGLLLRLVRRDAGKPVTGGGDTPGKDVLPALYVLGVGRFGMRLEQAIVSALERLKVDKALGGYGGFNPLRLQAAPIKPESGQDLSILQRDVSGVRAAAVGRSDEREERAAVSVKFAQKVIQRVLSRRQSRGQLVLCVDAEMLEVVMPAIEQLHTAVPRLTILPVVRLPEATAAGWAVAAGLRSLFTLQQQGTVAASLVFDANSPFVHSRKVAGEDSQERMLVSSIAATLAASIQDGDQPTLAEIVATVAAQHTSVGVRTYSASVPAGREVAFYKALAGRDAARRGTGDVGVAVEEALVLTRRLMDDESLGTMNMPIDSCGPAVALTFEAPIRSVDAQRWKIFIDGVSGELPAIAPGALAIFTHGAGIPLDRTATAQDGYTEQVTVWFGMHVEDWVQPYLTAAQRKPPQLMSGLVNKSLDGRNGNGNTTQSRRGDSGVSRLQPLPAHESGYGRSGNSRRRAKRDPLDPLDETEN